MFAGVGALFHSRYGRTRTLLLGAVIVPLLLVVGGRQTKFSTSEGTGQQRVKIWMEGFVALQSSPVFGIGMDQYKEEVGIVAHNSFVHSYVELGLVGGTCFFALFYLPCRSLGAESRDQATGLDPELMRLRSFMFAILVATVVGMLSSSRSYSVPTYLIVGLCGLLEHAVRSRARLDAAIQLESRQTAFLRQLP